MNEDKLLPVRKVRILLGKSQVDVCKFLQIPRSILNKIELGRQKCSLTIAEQLTVYYRNLITEIEILYPERYIEKWERIECFNLE